MNKRKVYTDTFGIELLEDFDAAFVLTKPIGSFNIPIIVNDHSMQFVDIVTSTDGTTIAECYDVAGYFRIVDDE